MAAAFLNKNFNTTTITKKRKNEGSHQGGKKRSHTLSQVSDEVILLDPRPQRKITDQISATDSVAAAAAAVGIEADISYVQPIQTNMSYIIIFYYVFILSAISPYTTGLKALFNQSGCTGTAPTHK